MSFINTRSFRPFECELGQDYVLVHFGTVVCQSSNDLNNVFIPSTEFGQLKRDGEKGVSYNNIVNIDGNGVIYLEVNLSETFYEEKINEWRDCFYAKDNSTMEDYLDKNFAVEAREDYFTQTFGAELLDPLFSPLVNISPKILDVRIKFLQTNPDLVEDLDSFNFITADFKKNIPIAIINSNSKPVLTQILDIDYFFVFPTIWKAESAELFLEPNE